MRRTSLVLLLLLAACGGMAPGPPEGPAAQLRAGFPPGGVADTIVVEAVERLPLRGAVLLAPDGAQTPASSIDVVANPQAATGQWSVGTGAWTSSLAGGLSAPAPGLAPPQAKAAFESREQLLAMVSTADIPLPDPVAYRRDWQRSRLLLTFGTPPAAVETREIPAPAPPPR